MATKQVVPTKASVTASFTTFQKLLDSYIGDNPLVESSEPGHPFYGNQYVAGSADSWTSTTHHTSPATHTFAGKFMHDQFGVKHYVKVAADDEHLRVEHAAQRLAHLAGVNTAQTHLVTIGGKLHLASEVHPTAAHVGFPGTGLASGVAHPNITGSYAAHAWLGNWDAAGKNYSNVVHTANGPQFLDFGGSLHRRAMGAVKEFKGGLPSELETLKSASKNPTAAHLFSQVTHEDIKQGVGRIAKISDDQIHQVVASSGLTQHTADVLISRKNAMVAEYSKPPHEHVPYGVHAHASVSGLSAPTGIPGEAHSHVANSTITTLHNLSPLSHEATVSGVVTHDHHGLGPHDHLTTVGHVTAKVSGSGGVVAHTHEIVPPSSQGKWEHGNQLHFDQHYAHVNPVGYKGESAGAVSTFMAKQQFPMTSAENSAKSHYEGSGYGTINQHFRMNGTLAGAGTHAKLMVDAINKSPGLTEEVTLFRGVHGSYATQLKKDATVGGIIVDKGFMSTSLNSHTPVHGIGSAGTNGVLMVLKAPKGYPVLVSGTGEKELILKPHTQFTVDRIETNYKVGPWKNEQLSGMHVVYGTILPHTQAQMAAAKPSEQALYKMPTYKTYPKCPYCGGHYKDIPKHVLEGKGGVSGFKAAHSSYEQVNPLLPAWFKKQGMESHTHPQTFYGLKADGTWGSQTITTAHHFHNPATNGGIYVPGALKSGPAPELGVPTHGHATDYHSHPEHPVPHIHVGTKKAPMVKIKDVYGSIPATHKHLPNGKVEKLQ